jgi:hemolysin III
MTRDPDLYPTYARSERIADGVIHGLGVALARAGAAVLVILGVLSAKAGQIAAASIYGGALVATFAASACYHMTPLERLRPTLRRLDHAAIYLKIAGTYTPLVVLIGSAFAYVVLGVVWALAVAGMAIRLLKQGKTGRIGPAIYLFMGWLSLLLVWPMMQSFSPSVLTLVLVGGLLYTVGVIFFRWESLRYSNAIWHGFVLAASGCFFAAITLGMVAQGA